MTTRRARGADDQVHAVGEAEDVPSGGRPRRALCGRAVLLVGAAPVVTTCPACVAAAGRAEVSFAHEPCG